MTDDKLPPMPEAIMALPDMPDLRYHCEYRRGYANCLSDVQKMNAAIQPALEQDRARLDAVERMGPNGTLRIDDERGLAPRYIHWGGSTGLTIRDAIDIAIDLAAIRSRSEEVKG